MNPIIAKIEKLLRLSQDQDGTPEGETAARLASRMMAAHAIEMASIDLDKEVEHDPMEKQDMQVRVSVPTSRFLSTCTRYASGRLKPKLVSTSTVLTSGAVAQRR